jgi:hypothetical protein
MSEEEKPDDRSWPSTMKQDGVYRLGLAAAAAGCGFSICGAEDTPLRGEVSGSGAGADAPAGT